MQRIILPSITTAHNDHWELMVREVKDLGVTEIALFVTTLEKDQRLNLYQKLKEISGLKIPFVHARSDMRKEEYEFLVKVFNTERFNLHPLRNYPVDEDLGKLKEKIFIENGSNLLEGDLEGFAGICLDLAHLDFNRRYEQDAYQIICDLIAKYSVGTNHISAIVKRETEKGHEFTDWHTMSELEEFDYLKKYPENFFGNYLALELTNSISEQLKVKKYLQELFLFPVL